MTLTSAFKKFRPTLSNLRTGVIGVEFALDAIHAVQLIADGDALEPHATASVRYPNSRQSAFENHAELLGALKELVRTGGFDGRKVVTALPPSQMKILQIQYPATKESNESRVILDQVKDRLPDPLTEYVLDYVPVRYDHRDGQHLALVAVSRRATVLELLKTLRKARLDPHAIEIGPVAIRRLVARLATDEDIQNVLVVNGGERKTFLTMISGRRLLMDQEVALGQHQLLEAVTKTLTQTRAETLAMIRRYGLTSTADDDADTRDQTQTLRLLLTPGFRQIADEIDAAFGYAASVTRGAPARKIFLSGSVARWPGAATLLAEIVGVEVQLLPSPFTNPQSAGASTHEPSELTIATGLALRGIVDDA